jgi:hypothetical protein
MTANSMKEINMAKEPLKPAPGGPEDGPEFLVPEKPEDDAETVVKSPLPPASPEAVPGDDGCGPFC